MSRLHATAGWVTALLCVSFAAHAATTKSSATPRLADGHPDLNGTWDNGGGLPPIQPEKKADGSVCIYCNSNAPAPTAPAAPPPPDVNPNPPPYRPELLAKVKDLKDRQVETDLSLQCRNPGVPRIGPPDKIVQTKGQVVFLYDDITGQAWRIIPTDGRGHRNDVAESNMGDSVGHWEGDTLVVDVTNFNEDTWLGDDGLFHSRQLHVIERLQRHGATINYNVTVEDPNVLLKPWIMTPRVIRLTDQELEETPPCIEQSLSHMTNETYHQNPR